MESIRGLQVRAKTKKGHTSRIRGYIFANNACVIEQIFFTEPDYPHEKFVHDVCIRETKNYKLIKRRMYFTLESTIKLFNLINELLR